MLIESIADLKNATNDEQSQFEVSKEAYDFCDQIRLAQISGSGADWSIAATNGWLALVTGFNHKIHRAFMSQEKRDIEDLKHIIMKKYIIKKTDSEGMYELVLRK